MLIFFKGENLYYLFVFKINMYDLVWRKENILVLLFFVICDLLRKNMWWIIYICIFEWKYYWLI